MALKRLGRLASELLAKALAGTEDSAAPACAHRYRAAKTEAETRRAPMKVSVLHPLILR